jgi:hypothetical protein
MSITWSTQARRDLQAIRDFIAHDSEHYARWQIASDPHRFDETAFHDHLADGEPVVGFGVDQAHA